MRSMCLLPVQPPPPVPSHYDCSLGSQPLPGMAPAYRPVLLPVPSAPITHMMSLSTLSSSHSAPRGVTAARPLFWWSPQVLCNAWVRPYNQHDIKTWIHTLLFYRFDYKVWICPGATGRGRCYLVPCTDETRHYCWQLYIAIFIVAYYNLS